MGSYGWHTFSDMKQYPWRMILWSVFAVVILGVVLLAYAQLRPNSPPTGRFSDESYEVPVKTRSIPDTGSGEAAAGAAIEVVAEDLEIPWDIAFLPDGSMLVTERPGRLVHIETGTVYPIEGVEHVGEGGLLGIALHPEYETNGFVYLYQTTRQEEGLSNRVVRYTYRNETLTFDRIIVENLPGAIYHDGGRIAFGPDKKLYIALGDAGDPAAAQDPDRLEGSILRINEDGTMPSDNPFGNAVYSYGHRNPQGLTWDWADRLWSTEHGRSGLQSGFDELNLIQRGQNYGWPDSQGDSVKNGTVGPALHSTASVTWALASALFHNGGIYFGGLRGETLYEAVIEDNRITELRERFKGEYGRIRTVVLGPDGSLYFTTSNRDGRGNPVDTDDRIIRFKPQQSE
ncbi:PQQ-dependent sugar dehydrogenase [Candidatus Uhrbacteria bacterium]|nr:PQQ-dependent sugar dehydrogenase [Candidatus Uhrbacteria bacterium]